MAGNSIGKEFVVSSFGESHGKQVGVLIDGCPAGLAFAATDVQADLDLRIPKQNPNLFSSRVEKDTAQIHSGIFNGFTTGAPICITVENRQTNSQDYSQLKTLPRPAHSDYPASIRYGGFNDYCGGGRFSGRLTVALIMAGSLAKKLLNQHGIQVLAYTKAIGKTELTQSATPEQIKAGKFDSAVRCPDLTVSKQMEEQILQAREAGDSVGGVVECVAVGVPAGVGEPLCDALDADLAKALFAVPAIKGVEFGAGFAAAKMLGSQHNDNYTVADGKVSTVTNNAGGILGGLSSGMPIVVRVAVKPTPSIAKEQQTVDLSNLKPSTLRVGGRHDPCVVPKAVPAVEAVVAVTLVDHLIRAGVMPKVVGAKP
ncbi:MAG: chorismate synthase [Candidatus Bathyarchaeota archaeon]|nr:chorismate synthase [Candidatus Bathyarchaeota archaeon]